MTSSAKPIWLYYIKNTYECQVFIIHIYVYIIHRKTPQPPAMTGFSGGSALESAHKAARNAGIVNRQLITNGFFSRDDGKIKHVANALVESGVNDIMLSVDAFHQETIPIEPVMSFASALQSLDIPKFRVHPAWLVSKDADNPYNNKTREILSLFTAKCIPVSSGNVIFPGGNALKYLNEYFDLSVPHISPYVENPYDITAVCVVPNGSVLSGNIYQSDIFNIMEDYTPEGKRE
jgi:hypothetical protein